MDYNHVILPILKEMDSEHLLRLACDVHSKGHLLEAQGLMLVAEQTRRICADIEAILEKRGYFKEGKAV